MKCKDLDSTKILKYLLGVDDSPFLGAFYWELDDKSVPNILNCVPKDTPQKLILAKMRGLISKGLVDGCACGCRGDFRISEKGIKHLTDKE